MKLIIAILLLVSCAQENIAPKPNCWRCTAWLVVEKRRSHEILIDSWEEKQCGLFTQQELDALMHSRKTVKQIADGSGIVYTYLNCTELWH